MPHLHLRKYLYFRPHWQDGRQALFWSATLRTFGLSLIGIFLPVYVFTQARSQLGVDISRAAIFVFLYYLVRVTTSLLTDLPLGKLVQKLRFRYAVKVSNLLLLVKVVCWFLAQNHFSWLWPAAVLGGLAAPLYWQSYHTLIIEEAGHQTGKTISLIGILGRIAAALGPALGGLVIAYLGWGALFGFIFIAILFSGIPLMFMSKHPHDEPLGWLHLFRQLASPSGKRLAFAFAGSGLDSFMQWIAWPLWLFLTIRSFTTLGALTSASLVFSVASLFTVGRWIDRGNQTNLLKIGALINALIWGLKLGGRNLPKAFALDLANNVNGAFFYTSLDACTYSLAQKDKQQFIVFRALAWHLGAVIGLIIAVFLVVFVSHWWWAIFGLAALSSLASIKLANSCPSRL